MVKQVIERTLPPESDCARAAEQLLSSDSVSLPLLPEVSVRLMELTSDVNCDPAEIIELLRRDQSLTGHLLRTANSVRYTCGQTVTSIQQAVARLGLLCIREVVMMISCQSEVFHVDGFEDDVRQSFDRSLATAAFSQEIARVRRINVEDAFLCGLMHDVGRPVLLQALIDLGMREAGASDDAVREAAEQFRIPMARRLVLSWDLPERLAATIEHQHTPLEAGDYVQQAAVLNLAIDLAKLALNRPEEWPEQIDHPMLDVLSLYPNDLAPVAARRDEIITWVGTI